MRRVPQADPASTDRLEQVADGVRDAFCGGASHALDMDLRVSSGVTIPILRAGMPVSTTAPLEDGVKVAVPATLIPGAAIVIRADASVSLAQTAVKAVLARVEAEHREEELLEELGTSWESLEALYEISTDVQQSSDITEALRRLMERLASRQEGLRAAVVLANDDQIEPLVTTTEVFAAADRSVLGDLDKVLRDRRLVVLSHLDGVAGPGAERLCWSRATSLAAAPIVSRETSVGFVIVWREDRDFALDAQISRMLEAVAYQTSILMESDRLNRQVRESELLAQEVQIASSIQKLLLFGSVPQGHSDVEVAAFSAPSQQIDGDFYDFFQHADGSFDLVIGDVMGKGVSAALLGAATKSQILRAMADLAIGRHSGPPAPAAIMNRVASRMAGQLMDLERFVTLCYARFDFRSGSLVMVDCGHTGAIRRRRENGLSFLRGDDLPLGVESEARFEELLTEARPGDTYMFYSDGITENRAPDGELYGEERLVRCVEHWSSLGPKTLVEQIRREATAFRGSSEFSDDFTCVAVRVRVAKENQRLLVSRRREFQRDLAEVPALRSWLRESTEDLSAETVARMEDCCSELFADLVQAGDSSPAPGPIVVETTAYETYATLSVGQNQGDFHVQCISAPALEDPLTESELPLTRRSADEICHRHDRNGASVVTLSFARDTAHSRDGLHASIR